MFQHLDIVITFVVLMLVASLFIMAATQVVVSLLSLRGANLRRGLVDLFETACPGQEASRWAKEIASRVLRHPAISDSIFSHFRLRADKLPFIPPETAGKLQGMGASIPLLPWIVGAVGGLFITPTAAAIAKHWFPDLCQYADQLAGHVSVINFCHHPWRTGALVGAILGGLLSRWRVATFIRVEELPVIFEKLAEPLPGTLPDPAQRAMLLTAWSGNEQGARSRPGAPQESAIVRSKPPFDEGIVRHASVASSLYDEGLSPAEDFDEGIVRHAGPTGREATVAFAVENATAPAKELEPESPPAATGAFTSASTPSESRLEIVRAWFDYVMDRASQRFAFQTRLVTIVLSCIFVFAAHFDAVRLFRSMSEGAELRARLAATAEALEKNAEQLSGPQGSAHIVPDVYRNAMVSILSTAPAIPEASPAKQKAQGKEREKVAAPAPAEDSVTTEAKYKAMRALETSLGFASREEAESWLRATLDGSPARETLVAAYQQEVNDELVSESDKLIDQSASLRREVARSEPKLFQDEPLSLRSSAQVLGLLLTIAFLSLGAAFWYNTLKNLVSLRPHLAIRPERERRQ